MTLPSLLPSLLLAAFTQSTPTALAFTPATTPPSTRVALDCALPPLLAARRSESGDDATPPADELSRRRSVLGSLGAALAAPLLPLPARSEDAVVATAPAVPAVEMKTFLDPEGLFVLNVPKRYYALRRKAKGDLPNTKTGKGRRGSSIFTAGDMSKAEVVAVERFPTAVLLEEEGIAPVGDLSTFPSIGSPVAVAELLNLRREQERQQQSGGGPSRTQLLRDSVALSPNGKTLSFTLRSKIDVQKPELLMEQMGVSELYRVTVAKATLESNDGNIMAVFAGALETDFRGPDGDALRGAVDSFRALDISGRGG